MDPGCKVLKLFPPAHAAFVPHLFLSARVITQEELRPTSTQRQPSDEIFLPAFSRPGRQ